ncbi:MAG: glycosyl transferase, group 1 [Rhizorhabdus sp.]|nr:glycosyl transferase, group 1 [Rhizorhabdus sp.]
MIEAAPLRRADHIAIVMHDFSTGGSERIAVRLANRWAAAGRRVTIICGTTEGPARALVSDQVVISQVYPRIRRSPLSRIKLAEAIEPHIQALLPDLIFAPGNFHISVAGLLARRLGPDGPPIICKLSNPLRRNGRGGIRQWIFERSLRRFAGAIDGFVAMSASLHAEAMAVLGPAWIDMIPEPVLEEASDAGPFPEGPPTILCIGRLVAQKNFLLAIRAFAAIAPTCDARLLIVGEGDQRRRLEREIARLGLGDRILLPGHVANVPAVLAEARLVLLTSDFEGYPAVMIEALAARRPVLATRCSPAIDEILLHRSFGYAVPGNVRVLSMMIESLLSGGSPDEAALAPLLARHRIDQVAPHYLQSFDTMVGRGMKRAACLD